MGLSEVASVHGVGVRELGQPEQGKEWVHTRG